MLIYLFIAVLPRRGGPIQLEEISFCVQVHNHCFLSTIDLLSLFGYISRIFFILQRTQLPVTRFCEIFVLACTNVWRIFVIFRQISFILLVKERDTCKSWWNYIGYSFRNLARLNNIQLKYNIQFGPCKAD